MNKRRIIRIRCFLIKNEKKMLIILLVVVFLIVSKTIWVICATSGHGSFEGEENEIIRRANYLVSKVVTSPQQLIDEMPRGIDRQFQGEWALYTCSMTCTALANIAILYPKNKKNRYIISIK